jgi:hypothetical protein
MKKLLFVSLLGFAVVLALHAQTEPQKSPLSGQSPPTGVSDAKKAPAD